MTIKLDHIYFLDQDHRTHQSLDKYGFNIDHELMVQHPGSNCKFLRFIDKTYLEFVSPVNELTYEVGISLRYAGNLHEYYTACKNRGLPVKFSHRNYSWKENSKDNLPGWNFMTFEDGHGFDNFFLWFTEYEPRPEKSKLNNNFMEHKNMITGLSQIHLDLNLNSKELLIK